MTDQELKKILYNELDNLGPKNRVLVIPPDYTRYHSYAGKLTEWIWEYYGEAVKTVLPALGTHSPMTEKQIRHMFGKVPQELFKIHDWRKDVVTLGHVPSELVRSVTEGKLDFPWPVQVNRMLVEEDWDLIINIGHVVPHEVLGFANHNKNYFIGLGGKDMICASHMMAACCGIENNLGQLITPLRTCYNKVQDEYLSDLPDMFFQVVMAYDEDGKLGHTGVYAGDDLDTYLDAAKASREQNITIVPPLKKVVAVMQGDEFYSTWVANKAIYRTRMAMANAGELLIIAPGLKRFGEQPEVDELIRKYGYTGTPNVMKLWKTEEMLQDLTHGTAHLIHGSSEGRFKITYAPGHLTKEEVEGVNFGYADYKETIERYNPEKMKNGFNIMPDGEEVYFISTPSAGLWSTKEKLSGK